MHLPRVFVAGMLSLTIIAVNGCRKSSTSQDKPSDIKIEPRLQQGDEPPTVLFDIKLSTSASTPAPFQQYDCTYQAQGKTARFGVEFTPKHPEEVSPAMEGKFIAVPGSDNSVLLEDLKKALDARQIPTRSPKIAELPFDAILLDDTMSRSPQGTFSEDPSGRWMMIKIFLPKGGHDEGELFLFLNPTLGKAEFSMKDSDYGDYLLKEFAKVL